jgi:hypothetical protein
MVKVDGVPATPARSIRSMTVKTEEVTRAETTERRLVERQCVVCEWRGEVTESPGDAPECPWCHAPTEVVRIISGSDVDEGPGAKNPHAAALGRLGGLKGGRARADRLSAAKRREIARKAARARWRREKQ